LSAADLSVIRRRKRHLWSEVRSPDAVADADAVADDNVNDLIFSPVHHLAKRSSDYCFSVTSNSTMCVPVASGALVSML
jgi:hypothetical protein